MIALWRFGHGLNIGTGVVNEGYCYGLYRSRNVHCLEFDYGLYSNGTSVSKATCPMCMISGAA